MITKIPLSPVTELETETLVEKSLRLALPFANESDFMSLWLRFGKLIYLFSNDLESWLVCM